MNTLDMGNGKTIAYDLRGIVSVSDFKYVSATDNLVFGVKHWNPTGGPMSLKIGKNVWSSKIYLYLWMER